MTALLRRLLGPEAVDLMPVEAFERASDWSYAPGMPPSPVRLSDGRELPLDAEVVTFNRIHYIRAADFSTGAEADWHYAVAERRAALLGWLAALPGPIVNRPDSSGLSGFETDDLGWAVRGGQCGLPVTDAVMTTSTRRSGWHPGRARRLTADIGILFEGEDLAGRAGEGGRPVLFMPGVEELRATILVAGDEVLGDASLPVVPAGLAAGALALARSVGCALLELTMTAPDRGSGWRFLRASPRPRLDTALHLRATVDLLRRLASEAKCC